MARAKADAIHPHWLAKSLAGVVLGLLLALGCSGIFALLNTNMEGSIKVQLTMWLVVPIWLAVLSGCYGFRDGWRAWLWLTLANLLVWLPQLALRQW